MHFLHIQIHTRTTVTTYTLIHIYTHIEETIFYTQISLRAVATKTSHFTYTSRNILLV